jgi:hypothetical protein
MFFFFAPKVEFVPGKVCEIIQNDNRHSTMPKLFPDRLGDRIVIDKVMGDYVWAYDDKSVKYRINNNGRKVVEFDPRCVTTPYRCDNLRVIDEEPRSKRTWNY